jgi:hypothetical protein
MADHVHIECQCSARYRLSDLAQADNTQRFAFQRIKVGHEPLLRWRCSPAGGQPFRVRQHHRQHPLGNWNCGGTF